MIERANLSLGYQGARRRHFNQNLGSLRIVAGFCFSFVMMLLEINQAHDALAGRLSYLRRFVGVIVIRTTIDHELPEWNVSF